MIGAAAPMNSPRSKPPAQAALRANCFCRWGRSTTTGMAGSIIALAKRADLRAADAEIGERVIIKSHELVVGLPPAPPFREGLPSRDDQVEE